MCGFLPLHQLKMVKNLDNYSQRCFDIVPQSSICKLRKFLHFINIKLTPIKRLPATKDNETNDVNDHFDDKVINVYIQALISTLLQVWV